MNSSEKGFPFNRINGYLDLQNETYKKTFRIMMLLSSDQPKYMSISV